MVYFGLCGYTTQITLASDLSEEGSFVSPTQQTGCTSGKSHQLETLAAQTNKNKNTRVGLFFLLGKRLATCTLEEEFRFKTPPPQNKTTPYKVL